MSIELQKIEKFRTIAEQLYTQEYLGINEYGKDKEYEKELTDAATDYLVSLFLNISNLRTTKDNLIRTMNKKQPQHKSNIISLIVSQ